MTLEARSALGGIPGLARVRPVFTGRQIACELIERSDLGCLLCSAAVEPAAHLAAIEAAAGVKFPMGPGPVASRGLRRAVWMSPRSWLLLCPLGDEDEILWSFTDSFADRGIHASRYSDQLCWLELVGQESEDLLRTAGFLSLDADDPVVGSARRGRLAGVAALVFREEEVRWLLGIERSYAGYMVEWLAATVRQKDSIGGRS